MAQDLRIANALYNDVPAISIPTQGGGSASFVDTSDADAMAEDILEGKSAYVGGAKVIGTGTGNYLPLSGGTLTGVVNGVTPPNGDNSTKIATTEFVNAKAGNYLPLSGGSITGDVDITGDLSVAGAIYSSSGGVLPGTVTAFSGTFKDGFPVNKNTGLVNKEWHLCNGTNGTPDLRNRFIYGGDGTNNGKTGGEASHKLTEAELPALSGTIGSRHGTHGGIFERPATGVFTYQEPEKGRTYAVEGDGSENWVTYHTAKLSFGGDQPHNNMPPYYTLAFIMKL